MTKALRYFSARFKRALRYYPAVLAFVLLTAVIAAFVCGTVFSLNEEEAQADKIKVKIGIVGNLEETYLDLAVFALQNADSSKYYAQMITMNEETAKKQLADGKIIGYVYIPEGYIEEVMSGEIRALSYVVNDSPASVIPLIMNEVVSTVSHYVTSSENGIYAYMDFCRDAGIKRSEYRKTTDKLSIEYVKVILDRESATETTLESNTRGLDFKEYYLCVFFTLLVMLWGIAFAPMMIKKESALQRLLAFRGVLPASQIIWDFACFFILMVFNVLLIFILAAAFGIFSFAVALGLFVKLLPAVLLLSCMQYLLYEISESVISAVLLQLFVAVAGGFASGFFYFRSALPESISKFGAILPTGVAFDYVTSVWSGNDAVPYLVFALISSFCLLALCILARIRKIRGVA